MTKQAKRTPWVHDVCPGCRDILRDIETEGESKPFCFEYHENGPRELCCFCGKSTNSGIRVMIDKNIDMVRCNGKHEA